MSRKLISRILQFWLDGAEVCPYYVGLWVPESYTFKSVWMMAQKRVHNALPKSIHQIPMYS